MDNRKLLLLLAVPAAAMMCRASARRAAWLEAFGPEGSHHGHGHGRPFGRGRFGPGAGFGAGSGFGPGSWSRDAGAWRLPPFIEAKLDEWHRAAHEGAAATPDAAPTGEA